MRWIHCIIIICWYDFTIFYTYNACLTIFAIICILETAANLLDRDAALVPSPKRKIDRQRRGPFCRGNEMSRDRRACLCHWDMMLFWIHVWYNGIIVFLDIFGVYWRWIVDVMFFSSLGLGWTWVDHGTMGGPLSQGENDDHPVDEWGWNGEDANCWMGKLSKLGVPFYWLSADTLEK